MVRKAQHGPHASRAKHASMGPTFGMSLMGQGNGYQESREIFAARAWPVKLSTLQHKYGIPRCCSATRHRQRGGIGQLNASLSLPFRLRAQQLFAFIEGHTVGCVHNDAANLACRVLLEFNRKTGPVDYAEGGSVVRS